MLPFILGCCCLEQRGELTAPKETRRHRPKVPDWNAIMKDDQDVVDALITIVNTGILDE